MKKLRRNEAELKKKNVLSQPAFTYSKLTIEQGLKYVQS